MAFDPTDDEELLQMLRSAVNTVDPVPDHVVQVAKRAHSWDTELSELVVSYDSAELATSALRSDTDLRDLTFSAGEIEFELTLERGRVTGLVIPPDTAVELRIPGQDPQPITVDESGRFSASVSTPAGAFVLTSGGEQFRTELVTFP